MPSTTPERAARWPGIDEQAVKYLERRGYVLNHDWTWSRPCRVIPKETDWDAMLYLIEEWDFGGLVPNSTKNTAFVARTGGVA